MQYDRYSTGPDNCLIDKLKVLSTSIVTGITKPFHYFETDIVFKLHCNIWKRSRGELSSIKYLQNKF